MRVAFIGDSHSQVTFPLLRKELEQDGHAVVYEQSKPGWGVKSYLKQGLPQLAQAKPEKVVLSLGGNNQNLSASYGDEVQNLLGLLRQAGAKDVLWVGPLKSDPAVAPSTARRHDWTRAWLQSNLGGLGATFLDTYGVTDLVGSRDGVHLTRGKYQEMVAALAGDVKSWVSATFPWVWLAGGLSAAGLFILLAMYIRRR